MKKWLGRVGLINDGHGGYGRVILKEVNIFPYSGNTDWHYEWQTEYGIPFSSLKNYFDTKKEAVQHIKKILKSELERKRNIYKTAKNDISYIKHQLDLIKNEEV